MHRTPRLTGTIAGRVRASPPWNSRTNISSRRSFCATRVAPVTTATSHSSSPASQQVETPPSQHAQEFGFKQVDASEKQTLVNEVFRSVASNYDVMNDLMSSGVHRLWKNEFVSRLCATPDTDLIDMAGGTGDIAFRVIESMRNSPLNFSRADPVPDAPPRGSVTVCDINGAMLGVGRERAAARGYEVLGDPRIDFVECNAEQLPFEAESFDAYTISFGIRNCSNLDKVLAEAYRVLRPGGRFMCLEFSHLEHDALQKIYDAYSFAVIPEIGHIVANDRDSYQYLVESIRRFPTQERFARLISDAGFRFVSYDNLTFGVAAIHEGTKPLRREKVE